MKSLLLHKVADAQNQTVSSKNSNPLTFSGLCQRPSRKIVSREQSRTHASIGPSSRQLDTLSVKTRLKIYNFQTKRKLVTLSRGRSLEKQKRFPLIDPQPNSITSSTLVKFPDSIQPVVRSAFSLGTFPTYGRRTAYFSSQKRLCTRKSSFYHLPWQYGARHLPYCEYS